MADKIRMVQLVEGCTDATVAHMADTRDGFGQAQAHRLKPARADRVRAK